MLSPRLALAALMLAPLPGQAADFWLIAKPTSLMAEDTEIPMWGFARASREQFGRALAGEAVSVAATVPGPPLQVPAGDTEITIHLLNQLPQPVSLILHGRDQGKPAEAAAGGGLQTYRWTGVKPGSFLYESGTDPAFQVQMGLYGPLVAEGGTTPVPVGRQIAIVFGEIDPGFHQAVGKGQPPASALDYKAAFHYAEPIPLDGTLLTDKDIPVRQGEPVLLRFYNAGLRAHAPVVEGHLLSVVTADGNPLPFPSSERTAPLPAGGTRDVLLLPSEPGRFALMDLGVQSGAWLAVENGASPQALADSYQVTGPLKVGSDKGVLANDNGTREGSGELQAVLVTPPAHAAAFALNGDGTFSYTPQPGFSGTDIFHYAALHGKTASGLASATLTVTAPPPPPKAAAPSPQIDKAKLAELKSPQADDHTFTISRQQAMAGAALNVLAHAKTPNAGAKLDPATIMVTKPAKGGTVSVDRRTGLISYKAPPELSGANTFLYAVKDTAGKTSNAATITVMVAP